MSLVFFEDIMKAQVDLIGPIQINANVSRKPSFGWGSSDDLRKFLEQKKEKHNPLVWSVPRPATDSGFPGVHSRVVELNLCVVESNTELINEVRMNPDRSFKKVLSPLWDEIDRRFQLSDITMVTDNPEFQPIPNYKLGGEYEGQFIWDVLKVIFTVNYSLGHTPCNQ